MCVLRDTRKSAHCLRLVGHTPRVSKRGQDTKWDAGRGMEEIHEFCFKDLPPSVLFRSFLFPGVPVISLIPILFRYGWRLRGRAGSDAASAGCAALRLARCMPPVMWESAGAASSASIKQARLMESSP